MFSAPAQDAPLIGPAPHWRGLSPIQYTQHFDFDELLPQTMHYYGGARGEPGPDRYQEHFSAHPFDRHPGLGDFPSAAEWWPSWPLWAAPLLLGGVLGIGAWLVYVRASDG